MNKHIAKVLLAFAILTLAVGCHKKTDTSTAPQTTNQLQGVSYQGQTGKTALEILKNKFNVQTKEFSGGEFVQTINGVTPDDKHYWSFYVNGAEATVGASQYVTKDSDKVEWKLKEINAGL